MKILIDATSLLLRSAGIKNYTYHWIRAMRDQGANVDAFPFLNDLGDLNHDGSNLPFHATAPRIAALQFVNRIPTPALDRIAAKYDLFHVSNQIRRPPATGNLTATVHDMTCWLMPELHTRGNVSADQSFAEGILKKARGLIAVSENTRQDAIRLLDLNPDRITTIYSGVPDHYFDAKPKFRDKPYLLFTGTIEPRKNVDTLLSAYRTLPPDLQRKYDLIIAGPAGWNSEETMKHLKAGMAGVHYLGYVPEADLPGLMAGATLFVYPSLYEGFGFPIAQAMAAGVPVVTSNTSCLPEVAGVDAMTCDPRSRADLTKALTMMLEHEALRMQLAQKGRIRAELFRWSHCAEQSLDFFQKTLG